MAKPRVRINSAGARQLLNSAEVQANLGARAARVAAAAGSGFESDVQAGKTRAHAMSYTTDYESRREQAKTNALLKALDAGR